MEDVEVVEGGAAAADRCRAVLAGRYLDARAVPAVPRPAPQEGGARCHHRRTMTRRRLRRPADVVEPLRGLPCVVP